MSGYVNTPLAAHWHSLGTWPYNGGAVLSAGWSNPGTAAWPTSDLAIYVPIFVRTRVLVRKLWIANGTPSGNVCVGLYDPAGVRLLTSGTVAGSGSVAAQLFDVTDTPVGVGRYYMGMVWDNTTTTVQRMTVAAPVFASGGALTEQLGAGAALPATATWAVDNTLALIPVMGLSLGTIL